MIQNINDLSVLLSIVSSFSDGAQKKELVSLLHDKYPYVQWAMQPRDLLDTAMRLNLLTMRYRCIILTESGRIVCSMATRGVDLNRKQIMYIAENCVLTNKNFLHLVEFLELFVFDKQHNTKIYNTIDYPISDIADMEILTQLGIIYKHKTTLFLNRTYLDLVDEITRLQIYEKDGTKAFTQENLERILAEQKEIGRIAEDLSMRYEKTRLCSKSLHKESHKIRHVSATNVNVGYDIESFRQSTPSLKHDLFIEVKARKHKLYSFIMSSNEVQVAKRLGQKYAVYFWNCLGYSTPSSPTRIIRDPVKKLQIQECDNCLSYIVYLDK